MLSLHHEALTMYFSYIDPKQHSGKGSQDDCKRKFFQGSFPP